MNEMIRQNYISYLKSALLLCTGILIISIIILSLVPPVSRDALVHHLAVPKLYLKHGGIYEIPFMPFSYYPMNLHLLYMIPLYFGNDILPKFMHFVFGLLTAWFIFLYLRTRTYKLYGLLGALIFLSTPVILKLSTTVYVDLGEIFFSFASIYYIFEWTRKEFRAKYLILAGIMCGLSLGTKYNGLATCFLLTLFIPVISVRSGGKNGFFKPAGYALIFLIISMVVFSPWMIRNYAWKGNPIYPLNDKLFNPPENPLKNTDFQAEKVKMNRGFFTYRSMVYGEKGWEIALLPLRIFFQGKDGDPQYFDGRLNPFLLFLPFFAFLKTGRSMDHHVTLEKKFLLWFAVLFFCVSFFSAVLRVRYIAPVIPPLVILSVFGLHNLFSRINDWKAFIARRTGNVLVTMAVFLMIILNTRYLIELFEYVKPVPYLKGEVSRDEYIAHYRPEYPAMQYINENLDARAKVFFMFIGNRGYYCDREYIYDMLLIENLIRAAKRPEDISRGMKAREISHLLVYYPLFERWMMDNFTQEKQALTRKFFQEYSRVIFYENGFGVNALRDN
ncbi:MAG: glycosyltransferase family 39 protein [Deltaproteobacteria bacterium]|nr:glycosyltransferase family 39 protein [Deltaproteobacteria bacterium]